jgi:hypothetical protein
MPELLNIVYKLWISGVLGLTVWLGYLYFKLLNNLAPGVEWGIWMSARRYWRDPSHFNAVGQRFRLKMISVMWMTIVWFIGGLLLTWGIASIAKRLS